MREECGYVVLGGAPARAVVVAGLAEDAPPGALNTAQGPRLLVHGRGEPRGADPPFRPALPGGGANPACAVLGGRAGTAAAEEAPR